MPGSSGFMASSPATMALSVPWPAPGGGEGAVEGDVGPGGLEAQQLPAHIAHADGPGGVGRGRAHHDGAHDIENVQGSDTTFRGGPGGSSGPCEYKLLCFLALLRGRIQLGHQGALHPPVGEAQHLDAQAVGVHLDLGPVLRDNGQLGEHQPAQGV